MFEGADHVNWTVDELATTAEGAAAGASGGDSISKLMGVVGDESPVEVADIV